MKRFNEFMKKHKRGCAFLAVALFLGLLVNQKCHPDLYCNNEFRSGCYHCVSGSCIGWIRKSISLWVVLKLGSFIGDI